MNKTKVGNVHGLKINAAPFLRNKKQPACNSKEEALIK